MKPIIHETLGHVLNSHTLEVAKIQDTFVGDEVAVATIKHGIEILQAAREVIRIKDGILAGLGQAGAAHRGDVNPGDWQKAGAAPRRGGNSAGRILTAEIDDAVARKEIHEMFRYSNRSHARPAATVRNAKSLVK